MSELLIKNKITGEWEAIPYIVGPQGETGNSGVHTGSEPPTDDTVNVWINPDANEDVLDFVTTPETAEVGQTMVVKEVDENGKPTAWEAADLPTEGKWELIASGTMEEDANGIEVTLDNAGNPFELTKAALYVKTIKPGAEMTSTLQCHISVGSWWWAGITGVSNSSHKAAAVAYANMAGPAFAAVNPGTGNTRYGNMLYLFGDDYVGQTITRANFNAAGSNNLLGAGLTYELWGVRK
jgi:hypothetical protein